jgi:hypothetical protein
MEAENCDCFVSRIEIYRWRAASTEAFALYVIVAECRAPKTFPSLSYYVSPRARQEAAAYATIERLSTRIT